MTTFDLRKLRLRSGDEARERVEIELEPLLLAGQEYEPRPNPVPAELRVTRASSGTVLELAFELSLAGPCFRCLQDAELELSLRLREYQATKPEGEEDRTEYLVDDRLDLSAWARDSIALALPDQILCRPDCAGLCPVCGKDLNEEPHEHVEERIDPRWEKLSELREGSRTESSS
ncbi:MAG: YceD family protein [Gaiellaceae bacterium]